MADKKINIIIKATTSAAQSAIKRLGQGLKSVGRMALDVSKRMARSMTTFTKYATAAVLAFGVSSIKAASDAAEAESKFKVVFGSMADSARKWSEDFASSVNRSAFQVREMMSAVQDLFVPLGFTRKEASAFSKDVAKLAIDIASFNNKADADVLRDIQSALVGNSETVRKYGIILTEAAIAEEAVAMGMAKTTKAVSNQAKAIARLSLIRKGSTDAQGDAIRTAKEFANVTKGLLARFGDFRKEVGKQLIAGLDLSRQFADWSKRLLGFTTRLKDTGAIEKFAETALQKLKPVKDFMDDLLAGGERRQSAMLKVKAIATDIGSDIANAIEARAQSIGTAMAKGVADALVSGTKGAGKAAIKGTGAGVAAKVAQIQTASPMQNIASAMNDILPGFGMAADASKFSFDVAVDVLKNIRDEIKGLKQPEGS